VSTTVPDTPRLPAAAVRADRAVLRAAHPVAFPLLRLAGRVTPAARVPGLGVIVNDPGLVRQVLTDSTRFRKDGPGSPGELWTPVVGPRALTNMEGAAHRHLRAVLAEVLAPAHAAALVDRAGAEPLAALSAGLRAGQQVELAGWVRLLVGAVTSDLLGARLPPAEGAALLQQGESLTAMVGPRTRQLTPAQIGRGRRVLARVTGPAGRAWDAGDAGTVPGRLRAAGVDRDDACGIAAVLFLTGTETVTSFLPRAVALFADSGLLATGTVRDTLGALGALLDEALRCTVPTPATLRRAVGPARLGPVEVRPGERLLVATLNAARAPAATGELRQVWFGAGPHFCPGRALALAQARALVTTLADAVTDGPDGHGIQVVRRRAARRVLIPRWRELHVRIGAG